MKAKILFLYPNASGIRRTPLGISILSACLKKAGHTVDLFDATFYQGTDTDNDRREELGFVQKVDMSIHYTHFESGDVREDFAKKVRSFGPDIICISLLQDNFYFTKKILHEVKEYSKAFVVAGGVMPSVAPRIVLQGLEIDAVIVGEGETAMIQLADCIAENGDPWSVPNISYIANGKLVQNPLAPLVPLTELPDHDYLIFSEEHPWRPFVGKSWKTGYFELTRGCPYSCTFCANKQINELYGKRGRMRSRSIAQLIQEVKRNKERYGLTLVSFCDENFLSLRLPNLEEFARRWESFIGIPFIAQTRVETITLEKLALFKRAGGVSLSIGIESGDEQFCREMLNRNYSNDSAKRAFEWCRQAGIRTTANNIIGFPCETEEHIKKTIILNRECQPDSISIAIFAPYMGCQLYNLCVENGLIGSEIPEIEALMYESCLDFSPEHKELVRYYFENFHRLVFSEEEIARPKSPR